MTQRDPRFFENPDQFDPERFAAGRAEQIPPYAYFPFGAGPHVCIGNTFAIMEMTLVVSTILQQFRVVLAPGATAHTTLAYHGQLVSTGGGCGPVEGAFELRVYLAGQQRATYAAFGFQACSDAGPVYLTITDEGTPDTLTGVTTPIAAEAAVHQSIDDHGVMKMRPVGPLPIEPGRDLHQEGLRSPAWARPGAPWPPSSAGGC